MLIPSSRILKLSFQKSKVHRGVDTSMWNVFDAVAYPHLSARWQTNIL
jgi:hypothetical protein